MKSQETGWLGNMLGWGQRKQLQTSEVLYGNAVEMARDPAFFNDHGVADNVDGRFDALALVVSLVMRRLASCGDAGADLSQQLFDTMFADMDLSLREMGAGDIGVAKRVRVMAEAFMGRLDAYTAALDAADPEALGAALERNLLRGEETAGAGLVDFVFALEKRIAAVDDDLLLSGKLAVGSDQSPVS
ncbi:MAG: ubiquinol-cytochrome C chaperone family protein [Pseudomonadota bacterium]|nr:ubiquinol-cytochrome C chaperone family protein [Pseudomonadota bacterium]